MQSFAYQKVVDELKRAIEQHTFRPGERLPSVRQLAKERDLSLSTVTRAFRELESLGLVEAQPQRGYFVRSQGMNKGAVNMEQHQGAEHICIKEIYTYILDQVGKANVVPLGPTVPSPEILPLDRLKKAYHRALSASSKDQLTFMPPQGYQPLQHAIAQLQYKLGRAANADDIVITSGCSEAISMALSVICQPGDVIAIESPTYPGILALLENLGLKVIEIHRDEQGLDMEALYAAIRFGLIKALFVTTNFHNPTGFSLPKEQKQQLVKWAKQYSLWIIEDDIYANCGFDEGTPSSLYHIDSQSEQSGRIIHCNSYSKTLAPGMRLGWLENRQIKQRIKQQKVITNLACPSLNQMALNEMIQSGDLYRHLKQFGKVLGSMMQDYVDYLRQKMPPQVSFNIPKGGFVIWLDVSGNFDSRKLFERAILENISIMPGIIFSASGDRTHCFRLTFSQAIDNKSKRAIDWLAQEIRLLIS